MKSRFLTTLTVFALGTATLIAMAGQASATPVNIVQNPGFESFTSNAWTAAPSQDGTYARWSTYGYGRGNTYGEGNDCQQNNIGNEQSQCTLTQNLATTAGTKYTLSFWVSSDGPTYTTPYDTLQIKWNGAVVQDIAYQGGRGWSQYTFTNLAATGTSTLLSFGDVTNYWSLIFIDDVSVVAQAPVPEPASMALLSAGLVGIGVVARRCRPSAVTMIVC